MNGLSGLAPDFHAMLVLRFLAGLPHGAYFGIAMLVAASLVPVDKRTAAVGRVILGLTVATTVGVPMANWIGQALGWRWAFAIVAGLGLLTAILVMIFAPRDVVDADASRCVNSRADPQALWLTLAIGAVGFGGLFSVYTYLASTMLAVTHVSPALVPVALCVFGVGLTAGNVIVPWFADRALMATAGGLLLWSAATLALYPLAATNFWTLIVDVLLIGLSGSLATVLQTRLMDVAGDAQSFATALNHSAFNFANAIGPWLGGMAVAAGFGWTSTGLVGTGLSLAGFVVWAIAAALGRREGV